MNNSIFSSSNNIGGIFSSNNNKNIFINIHNSQEDDENCCVVINDEKTELSQIKEAENESQSGTESAFKSRKGSQLNLNNLHDNYNLNEEKKEDEFLKPNNVNINNRNDQNLNVINFNNLRNANNHMDFEDEVNKKYGLFPII